MKEVRVRIAPSPTGIPHIGNTRTALFNYLFAKHNNGKFIVRVEDTDRVRIVPGAKEAIFEILNWLGISWDEEYVQSERKYIYKEHVDKLLTKGLAYKDEGAVRFKITPSKEISWTDAIGNKKISFKTDVIEDFIILKSDGFPIYHLANVVDDHLMNITHVIRGDEWISSTPKHFLLYEAFGWKAPVFAHLPVILGPDKSKLSKRHGAKSVLDYKSEGYLKEALINFMAFLGWNPGGEKEIIEIDDMMKLFDLKDVNTSSPIFDIKKLAWINGEYIRMMDDGSLKKSLVDFYSKDTEVLTSIQNNTAINSIIALAKTRMKTLGDFKNLVIPNKIELSAQEKNLAKQILERFLAIKDWNKDEILIVIREIIHKNKIKGNIIYKIITGFEKGLPLPESLEILGKEKAIQKLEKIVL